MQAPPERGRSSVRRALRYGVLGLVGALVLIQFVPYGRAHSNPRRSAEPKWDSPRTRSLALRACGDCHSAQTAWPWYTNVAPVSWLAQSDVDGGRRSLNFSAWDKPQDVSSGDIVEQIRGGSMPPWFYTIFHPNASLSGSEKDQLIRGLTATLAASPPR